MSTRITREKMCSIDIMFILKRKIIEKSKIKFKTYKVNTSAGFFLFLSFCFVDTLAVCSVQ